MGWCVITEPLPLGGVFLFQDVVFVWQIIHNECQRWGGGYNIFMYHFRFRDMGDFLSAFVTEYNLRSVRS
jgi:hypothetical protein